MFPNPRPETKLDKAIDVAMNELWTHAETSEEYATILKRVQELYKLKADQQPQRISPDTLILVAANLTGILLILHHEHVNVITSKAMNFVPKLR